MAARKIHRWKDPTYNLQGGAFPGGIGGVTYDRLNIGSEGAGGAPADAQKVGGNFPGTYGVDFEEDAKALAPNRMLRALGENTDLLDDLFRASVPAALKVSWAGGASFQSLVGTAVFVGKTGETVPLATELVQLVDTATGLPAVAVSGVTIIATDVVDDTSLSTIRGAAADGFSTNARVTWNAAVPAGAYTVIVGGRSSLATLSESRPFEFLRTLVLAERAVSAILGLYKHGLDERYRRSNKVVAGTENQAGAGASVMVDGQAVTLRVLDTSNAARRDPFGSLLTLDFNSYFVPVGVTNANAPLFGNWILTDGRDASSHIGGMSAPVTGGQVVAAVRPASTTNFSTNANTQIRADTTATLNPTGTATQIRVDVLSFFWRASGGYNLTMVRPGLDMLRFTRADGAVETYIISALTADTRIATLLNLNGQAPSFPSSESVTSVSFIQPYSSLGPSRQALHQVGGLLVSQLPDTREVTDTLGARMAPMTFLAPRASKGVDIPSSAYNPEFTDLYNDYVAVQFGGWTTALASGQAFAKQVNAGVLGNGRVFTKDFFHGAFRQRSTTQTVTSTAAGQSTTVTLTAATPHVEVTVQGTHPTTVAVSLPAAVTDAGCRTSITVIYGTLGAPPWMSWPAGLTFQEGDQQVPDGALGRYIWELTGLGGTGALVHRTYYPG